MYSTSTSVLIICSLLIQKVECFFLVTVGSHEKYQGVIFQMQSNLVYFFQAYLLQLLFISKLSKIIYYNCQKTWYINDS